MEICKELCYISSVKQFDKLQIVGMVDLYLMFL